MIGLVASQLMGRSRAASARFQPQTSAMFLGASAASARCMAFKAVSPPITYIAGAITSLVHLDWGGICGALGRPAWASSCLAGVAALVVVPCRDLCNYGGSMRMGHTLFGSPPRWAACWAHPFARPFVASHAAGKEMEMTHFLLPPRGDGDDVLPPSRLPMQARR